MWLIIFKLSSFVFFIKQYFIIAAYYIPIHYYIIGGYKGKFWQGPNEWKNLFYIILRWSYSDFYYDKFIT